MASGPFVLGLETGTMESEKVRRAYGDHETDLDAHLSPVRQGHRKADGNRLLEMRAVWLELIRRPGFQPLRELSLRSACHVLMELLFS